MLSLRQQHCLQGIGVQLWRERRAADVDPLAAEAGIEQDIPYSAGVHDQAREMPDSPAIVSASGADIDTSGARPVEESTADANAEAKPAVIDIPPLDSWEDINAAIENCSACELSQNCTRKVPGIGNHQADLLIVGEGPGHDEDLRGEPFVGRSGQLLDRMLAAIGFTRDQVYITNIVKCRPPNNRDPKPEEAQQCRVYLDAQIRLLAPKVILSVGRVSAHNLLGSNQPVGKLIQQMHRLPGTDIPLKVTYHPAYLLRNPSAKAIAWQDMKLLYRLLQ